MAAKEVEQRAQQVQIAKRKTEGNSELDKPTLEKNIGHLRLSGKDVLRAEKPENLPTCLRIYSKKPSLLEKVQSSQNLQAKLNQPSKNKVASMQGSLQRSLAEIQTNRNSIDRRRDMEGNSEPLSANKRVPSRERLPLIKSQLI